MLRKMITEAFRRSLVTTENESVLFKKRRKRREGIKVYKTTQGTTDVLWNIWLLGCICGIWDLDFKWMVNSATEVTVLSQNRHKQGETLSNEERISGKKKSK